MLPAAAFVLLLGSPGTIEALPYAHCVREHLADGKELEPAPKELVRQLKALGTEAFSWVTGEVTRLCHGTADHALWHHARWAAVDLLLRTTWPEAQLFALHAALVPAGEKRGLRHLALRELAKGLEEVDSREMTWLIVVSQRPSCSAALDPPAMENGCAERYRTLHERLSESGRR